ncbi:MAG: helix-turn-helix domain-containing protein [Duncaniella sp.]|nr:helix-turn-helix domain-containing protein [Duncaniella sp.]
MKIRLMFFVMTMLACVAVAVHGGEPYCNVRTYDERDGLSHRAVKQVVQDENGVLWVATWNGLNRFDGSRFDCIRPGIDDPVRSYSSRLYDIKAGANGALWCRIDGKLVRFDVNDYSFRDSHSLLEKNVGCPIELKSISISRDSCLVLRLDDGRFISIGPDGDETRAEFVTEPGKPVGSGIAAGSRFQPQGEYASVPRVLSYIDDGGTYWLVTRDGDILSGKTPSGPFELRDRLFLSGQGLRFCTLDSQGNLWMASKRGLHRLTIGTVPFTRIGSDRESRLRTAFRDSAGRIWLSWSDADCLAVASGPELDELKYIAADGRLSDTPVAFGAAVYSIAETPGGEMWLGTKPDGLYRLKPVTGGYEKEHYVHDGQAGTPSGTSYYDASVDSRGRLWLASMGGGIDVVEHPSTDRPVFTSLAGCKGYPVEARSVRRLMVVGDSLAVAATTGGLLTLRIPSSFPADSLECSLSVSEAGNAMSLGSVATMDVLIPDAQVPLLIATESDGVARMETPLDGSVAATRRFSSIHSQGGTTPDIALSMSQWPGCDTVLVVSPNEVYLLDPLTGETVVYGSSFWQQDMFFSDSRPMWLGNGSWLMGLENGAVVVKLDEPRDEARNYPLWVTALSIPGGKKRQLPPSAEVIELTPDERDITLHFATVAYAYPRSIRYAYKLDDDDWTTLDESGSLSFANLRPGRYTVSLRSTDTHGEWLDNERKLIIDVRPTFWETPLARVIYVLVVLMALGAIAYTIIYIKRIKRRQRELLESQLKLLETRTTDGLNTDGYNVNKGADKEASESTRRLSDEDKELMGKIMDFIEKNISDPSVTVDDMAEAVAVSRRGLTRKMKNLMGVTPADFMRETRLTRSASLLIGTTRPIKEIAAECGFSDINYFGKSFKSWSGHTPKTFRDNAGGNTDESM